MLIDRLFILRENRDSVRKEEKELTGQIEQLSEEIIDGLDQAGIDRATGQRGSVTKKIDIYPGIENKVEFYTWAVTNDRFEFLQSRVNSAPVKEMQEQNNNLPPGIITHTKAKLNVRKK